MKNFTSKLTPPGDRLSQIVSHRGTVDGTRRNAKDDTAYLDDTIRSERHRKQYGIAHSRVPSTVMVTAVHAKEPRESVWCQEWLQSGE